MPKRVILLHASFLIILFGALVTWLCAKESTMALRPGHTVSRYGVGASMQSPDTIMINGEPIHIAVNHPVTYDKCRLYLQSRLPGDVTVVSIRKDMVGTLLVFIGYFMYCLGGLVWIRHRLLWLCGLCVIALISVALQDSPLLQNAHWVSMALMSVMLVIASLIYKRALAYGLLAGACFAIVAALQAAHTDTAPMMPALQSPWLALHVAIIMLSYALLIIVTIMAIKGLTPRSILGVALWLLGLGIITGSVWANESWGRYWSWDPKETLALLTFLLYAIPLHLPRQRVWIYLMPLPALLMTWFGIGLFNSLHSY